MQAVAKLGGGRANQIRQLRMARQDGTGGSKWTVRRRTSGGVSFDAVIEDAGTRTLYVVQDAPALLQPSASGAHVSTDSSSQPIWSVYAKADVDLRQGDVITSVAAPGLSFRVTSLNNNSTDVILFGRLA